MYRNNCSFILFLKMWKFVLCVLEKKKKMGEEKSRDSKEMTYLFSFNQILFLPCNTVRIGVNRIRWMQRVHTRVKIVTTSTNRRNRGLVFKRCLEMIIQISLTMVGVVLRRENLSSRFERRILNIDLRSNEAVWRFSLSLSSSRERFNFTEATAVLSMLLQLYQSNRIELNGRLRNNGVSIILYNTLLYSRDISYCSNAYRTQSCFSFFLD